MPTSEPSRRKVGRPSTGVLTRRLILETALRLLDENGADGFEMKDVAAALEVRPSALYNHVRGKDAVLAGVRELVGERISAEVFDHAPWHEALTQWSWEYRNAFASHPPTIALLAMTPLSPDSEVPPVYDRVIRTLHQAGWGHERALNVLVALESFILGSALDLAAAPDMLNPGPRTDTPDFSRAYAERERRIAADQKSPADLAFETGLGLFIGALRAEHELRAR